MDAWSDLKCDYQCYKIPVVMAECTTKLPHEFPELDKFPDLH